MFSKRRSKFFLASLILMFILNPVYSQKRIRGIILDSLTKQAVEYCNVGIIGKGIGTVSNEKGEFELPVPDSVLNSDLKLSMIGYRSLVMPAKAAANSGTYYLSQASVKLDEIVVHPRKMRYKILGNETQTTRVNGGFKDNRLGAEIAVLLNIKHPNTQLRKLNFNITSNSLEQQPVFRVNVYSKGEDGLPSVNLLSQNIIVTPDNKTGLVEIDLKPYSIYCDKDVFIAIEWIKDLGDVRGLYFSCKLLGNGMCYRQTSQAGWSKVNAIGLGLYVEVAY